MIILGLDPGEEMGYGRIEVSRDSIKAIDYGVIPVTKPGIDGLLISVYEWLQALDVGDMHIAFEEFIPSQKLRTSRESVEVRGIVRLWCAMCVSRKQWAAYAPATVRSQLSAKNKADVRQIVELVLGYKVRGKDHVPDALGVALCHAIKTGLWSPRFDYRHPQVERKSPAKKGVKDPSDMSPEELRKAINSGDVRIGRR